MQRVPTRFPTSLAVLAVAALLLAASAPLHGSELPGLAERARGLARQDGFVSWYWDARAGRLLLEPPLGAELLYGAGLAGGAGSLEASLDRGQLGELGLVRFERVGPRVLLRQLQTRHRSGVGDRERTRVVEESFASSILAALELVAEEEGRVLVDATDFLLRDAEVAAQLKRAGLGVWRLDGARSAPRLERSGAFPRNTELEADLTWTSEEPAPALAAVLPDGRSLSLTVHHTFLKLPEPGYAPRALDPRVGFIPQLHYDHTAAFTEPIERYLVSRWRLRRRDPAQALSAPVEPIVFYLDRGMPEPERSTVKRAALWWNRAFEAAGFEEALVVRDLPEGATFLDARYSGIEWINRAERAWSIGDFQVDPRTGEIVHAVARIDSHRRHTTARMWQNLTPPRRDACLAAAAPELAWLAQGDPQLSEESLVLQRLAYLSAHEVGHTLGLMHNWAATTYGWGSVMDYLAPNIQPRDGGLELGDAYPQAVGPYDAFAIRWGYTEEDAPAALDAIVREAYAAGLVYPLEGDPRWAEYDWGSDPVAWLGTTQAVRRLILERFGAGQLAPGRPVHELQARFNLAYLYHRFGIQAAQQYVGGQYQANALAGDGQLPVAPVEPPKQREALARLVEALAPENLDVPDAVLAGLVPAPAGMRPTRERFGSEAGDVFSLPSAARVLVGLIVRPLLSPERAARLTLPGTGAALSLEELIDRLLEATWGADAPAEPRRAALLRVAQRELADALLDLAAAEPAAPEVRAAAFAALESLQRRLAAAPTAGAAEQAHRRLALRDVREFLEHPEARRPRPAPPASPPGRPIGQ